MAIQKVVKNSVSQQVFDQLKEQILLGTWKPGEKIPSENDLAAQFGVSRVTIRNALQRLSGLGLLETRFGEGSFVKSAGAETALQQLIPTVYLSDGSLQQVLEFRRIVEGAVCETACRKATTADIAELQALYEQMLRARDDLPSYARYDYAFHNKVVQITQNRMMAQLYQIIDEVMRSAFMHVTMSRGSQPGLRYHRQLLEAFETHDSTRAKRLMEQHMEEMFMISSIYQDVTNMEKMYADRVAIQYYDEDKQAVQSVLYREYARDIRRFLAYLQNNVPDLKGKHVAILARNSYHYAVAIFATFLSEAVLVPLNLYKNLEDIRYELELGDVECLLHDGEYLAGEPGLADAYHGQLLDLHGFTACPDLAELKEADDLDALALIMFTSGTTGRSKGVMLSQRNLFAPMKIYVDPFDDVREALKLGNYQWSSLNVLPMFHIAHFTSLISWSIGGNTINLCNNLKYFYRDLSLMPSDVMAVVPMLLKSIHHDVMSGSQERLGKLRVLTCGAATFAPAMLKDLMDNGFYIIQMYGLTETVGDGAWNISQEERHLTSVGVVDPDCEYKLDHGELCIKGGPVMLGYYKDPEATAEVLENGWLHTGDLARIDEEGYIYLTGRKKNLIILSSGENVSPEELEKLLSRNEDITEVLVKEKGDRICAVIYCDPAKRESIRRFVTETNRSLPLYKWVTVVEFSDEPLPRNATGKLKRNA